MYKQRITNGFAEKQVNINPLSLHSLLKNFIDSTSLPKSLKEVAKSNGNIEIVDTSDEQ